MKIVLTLTEAKKHIALHLSVLAGGYIPSNVEIEIVDDWMDKLSPTVRDLINAIDRMNLDREKIAAIKLVREKTGVELFDGKWIVEHWAEVKGYVRTNLRWPILRGNNRDGYVIV